jgi:hypothetical protein
MGDVYIIKGKVQDFFVSVSPSSGKDYCTKKDEKDNSQIEIDLYGAGGVYGRVELFPDSSLPVLIDSKVLNPEKNVKDTYTQGDLNASLLRMITDNNGYTMYENNDPRFNPDDYQKPYEVHLAYADEEKNLSGITLLRKRDDPTQWMIILAKNPDLPKDQSDALIITSMNARSLFMKPTNGLTIQKEDHLEWALEEAGKFAGSKGIEVFLNAIMDEVKDTMNEGINVLLLFTTRLRKNAGFEVEEGWWDFLKENSPQLVKSPLLIELGKVMEPDKTSGFLSQNQIRACLNPDSELSQVLTSILNSNLKNSLKVEHAELAALLDQWGYLGQYSALDQKDFVSKLAKNPKNHGFLKKLLAQEAEILNKEVQWLVEHQGIVGKILQGNEWDFDVFKLLIDLHKNPGCDNPNSLSAVIKYVHEYNLPFGQDFEKLKNFLRATQEKTIPVDYPTLVEFMKSHNPDQVESIKNTIEELIALEITSPKTYHSALTHQDFRDFVAHLPKDEGDKKGNKIFIELAGKGSDYLNPLLITLTEAGVTFDSEQAISILKSPELPDLIKFIQNQIGTPAVKRPLLQLAVDLAQLGHVRAYSYFQEGEPQKFHELMAIPGAQEVLREWLSFESDVGHDMVRLIIEQPNGGINLFKNFLAINSVDIKENMTQKLQLISAQTNAQIRAMALNILLEQPNTPLLKLQGYLHFLKTIAIPDVTKEIQEFLLEHVDEPELLLQVSTVLNKLQALGVKDRDTLKLVFKKDEDGKVFRSIIDGVPMNISKENIKLIRNLAEMGQLDNYPELVQLNEELKKKFNELANFSPTKNVLLHALSMENPVNECKSVLENQALNTLSKSDILPTPVQMVQFLDPNTNSSKAMDQLLKLQFQNPNSTAAKAAYKWSFVDTPEATQFRTILAKLDKDIRNPELRRRVIETLCLAQLENTKRNYFGLFLDNPKFEKAMCRIEGTCRNIKNHLESADDIEKFGDFVNVEQDYRKNLYKLSYDILSSNSTDEVKKDVFKRKVTKYSTEMLNVVDTDRHPWIRAAAATLSNALGFILLTIPNWIKLGTSGRFLFYSETQSGEDVRDLHRDLKNTLLK